ncbi:MAG: (p)ppGpp synthetase [Tissierellia bacterium]|nr:(p)ppGpp synthetase [Tissierellia bacterium]
MKLKLFHYVDEVLKLRDHYEEDLREVAQVLTDYFKDLLDNDDRAINITSRIKSSKSLRDKVIRRNYFLEHPDPKDCFENVPDLIGLRIECRFNKDEDQIYQIIQRKFRSYCGKGYYSSRKNNRIELNLEQKQPQLLNNGFSIYKVDGIYRGEQRNFYFELQIKSLVNVFWGEIDHKILYKNYNYMVTEGFFRDIMSSIIENLSMVDRQLMILYDHVNSLDASAYISAENQLKVLLSKIIHDVFVNKVYDELGFVFDLKSTSDVIVDYLFMKCIKNKDLSYGENFIFLINRINRISEPEMNLEEYIVFEEMPQFTDSFTRSIGRTLLSYLNRDFEWNIFFKIISLINEETMKKNIEDFLYFIRYEYTLVLLELFNYSKMEESEKNELQEQLLAEVAIGFNDDPTLAFLFEKSLPHFKELTQTLIGKGIIEPYDIKYYYKKNLNQKEVL